MWFLYRCMKCVTIYLFKRITLRGGRRTNTVAYSHEFKHGNNINWRKTGLQATSVSGWTLVFFGPAHHHGIEHIIIF